MEICSKTVTRNGGAAETTIFTYDEYNKLTTVQHPGGVTETLTYNANGQLTQSTKTCGGGGSETTKYYWNDQGFLTKVLLHTGEPVEYKYDGVGRLKGRKDADGEQIFVQSGWNIMTEQDTEGRRTYYTGSSSQTNNGGEANFFLFNHRGDTVLITDQTGKITNSLHYEAYGKITDNTGTPIPANSIPTSTPLPPLFVGAYGIRYDRKTELSYMRFRWYDYRKMRFISSDLLLSQNRYTYATNNPIKHLDPTGLFTFEGVVEYLNSVPGGQQYADIISQSQGNDYIRINHQRHLIISTAHNPKDISDRGSLAITKPVQGANGGWVKSKIIMPLWLDDQMAAATLVEELDHHRFYSVSTNWDLSDDDFTLKMELEGHTARIRFINSAIKAGRWKQPCDCKIDMESVNKKLVFEGIKPYSSKDNNDYKFWEVLNERYWKDVINLQEAYNENRLINYILLQYLETPYFWQLLEYHENTIYFPPVYPNPRPGPTPGR